MKTLILSVAAAALCLGTVAAEKETRFFEMRTYYAAPGKLDALLARFRDHTTQLFEKHGIVNVGYWTPSSNPDQKLVYVLAFPSRAARDKSFQAFGEDPAWKEVVKTSESNGKLVTKVESVFLEPTDFSPAVKPTAGDPPRLYELRTYKAAPGKLDALLARFRDHTTTLFAKHGMTQLGYWVPTEKKDGAGETLIYILAHKDQQAMESAFSAFRADPDWVKAKADSEAGGSLTIPNGVQSTPMTPTDFSPAR